MRHMTRLTAVTVLAAGLLFAVSVQLPAEPVDPLRAAFLATGAGRFDAVRYSGIGATFAANGADADGPTWTRTPFHRYDADVNLATGAVQVHLTPVPEGDRTTVAAPGAGATAMADEILPGADAVPQAWLTPHGFLRAARAHQARVTPGPRETAIEFQHGRHRVAGVLDERYQVDRVQIWSVEDDAASREARIEVRFRNYEPMPGAGAFPRHIIETRQGRLALDLWVWAAAGVPARMPLTPGSL